MPGEFRFKVIFEELQRLAPSHENSERDNDATYTSLIAESEEVAELKRLATSTIEAEPTLYTST